MADDNYEDKYTKPELRREIKEELMQSDKGGKPGQWSARKSQMLVQEYEKRGGGYKKDKKDEAAKSLEEWTEQEWQTSDGEAGAAGAEGMARYLPRDAWALLTEDARKAANKTKDRTDDRGEQVAEWPDVVRRAMIEIEAIDGSDGLTKEELYDRAQELEVEGRSTMDKAALKSAIIEAYEAVEELEEKTKEELYQMAQDADIEGRSEMNKAELVEALEATED
ncbi:Rho termination factor N-terminal domain-containing protein [Lewinella sp. W8]|uniref:Rho termination factor N-terminal domain-containing protein n=1 Tax=Lewinella sp. W8 TaxID=2528208 RepID=UPI00156574BC|nr:Rho termination factor N-terminal domain-containing protein [Lewinella sp. W8]